MTKQMKPKEYIISEKQIEIIGNYLMGCPMAQVEQSVNILRNLKEYKEPEPQAEPTEEK